MRVPFLDEMGPVFRAVKKRDILLHFPPISLSTT